VRQLDPTMLVFTRMGLAALILLPVAAARGDLAPVLRRWRPLLAFAAAQMIVPQFLLGTAEQRLPSATTGLLVAAVPLAGVGVAFLLGRPERLTGMNWLGIALGMAGVAALVGFSVSGADLGAVGEVTLVVVGYALSPAILARWMLAAVCSAGAFSVMAALVAEVGPVRATTVNYVTPAVALVASAIVLGERVTGWAVVGIVLILVGCFLTAVRRTGRAKPDLREPGGHEAELLADHVSRPA